MEEEVEGMEREGKGGPRLIFVVNEHWPFLEYCSSATGHLFIPQGRTWIEVYFALIDWLIYYKSLSDHNIKQKGK